jgi:hypothetical protein
MDLLQPFQKLGPAEIARRLNLHPFDVVRILVFHDVSRPDYRFDPSEVDWIRSLGGIETWWGGDCTLLDEPIRARGVLRSIVRELKRRGYVGTSAVRVDNVFRGMEPDDELLARKALNLLIHEHVVRSVPTAIGTFVSLQADQEELVEGIVSGSEMPAGLAALWLARGT